MGTFAADFVAPRGVQGWHCTCLHRKQALAIPKISMGRYRAPLVSRVVLLFASGEVTVVKSVCFGARIKVRKAGQSAGRGRSSMAENGAECGRASTL